jgi:DNA-binding LacI/PurR family transcriptional regulator
MGNSPVSSLPNPEEQKLLLADPAERPDVMVCWTDAYADGIAAFCLERGIRIPEDIALVGFDHLPSTRRPALRLTTIHAPWDEVARTAVQLLTAQCEGQSVPEKTVLPVELFVGHTT